MALGPSYKLSKIHDFLLAWGPNYKQTKKKKKMMKPRFTYPKTLNLEARLWNEKVLGPHFA